jgi:hypothetical protein
MATQRFAVSPVGANVPCAAVAADQPAARPGPLALAV